MIDPAPASTQTGFRLRPLGTAASMVPQVGLGTWPIAGSDGIPGYGRFEEARARSVLEHAIESGLRFFDTADVYGAGTAERLLGEALEGQAFSAVVCRGPGAGRAGRRPLNNPSDEADAD
jgi:aryl-alcohol dehydrogenase-like predicted oxidoreductase